MNVEFVVRFVGMIVFGLIGGYLGSELGRVSGLSQEYYAAVVALVGAIIGLALTPLFTTRPAKAMRAVLIRIPGQTLISGLFGLVIGLIIADTVGLLAYCGQIAPGNPRRARIV